MFNDYINNAPDCAERVHNCIKNDEGEWVHKRTVQRITMPTCHLISAHTTLGLSTSRLEQPRGALIKVLEEGDPEWLEHPNDPNTVLLQYDSHFIQNAPKFRQASGIQIQKIPMD